MFRYYIAKDGSNKKIHLSLSTKVIISAEEARNIIRSKCERTKNDERTVAFFAESTEGYITHFPSLNESEKK